MCGIAGLVQIGVPLPDAQSLLAMARAIRHRGPDDVGYICGHAATGDFALFGGEDTPADVFEQRTPYQPAGPLDASAFATAEYTLGLANRRLAIVDLSPWGHQPMCNEDRTLWIVYNGEIYNAAELHAELVACGHRFVSHADTEAILHAYEQWGEDCAAHCNGMWAFALWDIARRRLFISRDRAGIKPLYYWQNGPRFAFASEIKALLALDLPRQPNLPIIYDFLAGGLTDHSEETFFAGIRSLPAAHSLTLDLRDGRAVARRYWALDTGHTLDLRSDAEYAAAFRDLFADATRRHLISDVPVGTCLSGGLDSSAVVCVINHLIHERGLHVEGMEAHQKTFSARYDDQRHDEGRYIKSVIEHADVEVHTVYPTAAGLRDNWPALLYHQEEPFGSTSIFAQWSVFRLARQAGVTVTLDGQGGDELLAGYLGFFPYYFADLVAGLQWPRFLGEFRAHCARHGSNARREARSVLSNLLPERWKLRAKSKIAGQAPWLAPAFVQAAQAGAAERWQGAPGGRSRLARGLQAALAVSPLPSLLRFDDRNSMAHSIESRVPFLDHRLIEFCFALPAQQKIRQGATKFILREAMQGTVPADVLLRHDKIGFSTPQDTWLRKDLAPWLQEVFTSPEFRGRPYFQSAEVLRMLARHTNATADYSQVLWNCLVLELWHRALAV